MCESQQQIVDCAAFGTNSTLPWASVYCPGGPFSVTRRPLNRYAARPRKVNPTSSPWTLRRNPHCERNLNQSFWEVCGKILHISCSRKHFSGPPSTLKTIASCMQNPVPTFPPAPPNWCRIMSVGTPLGIFWRPEWSNVVQNAQTRENTQEALQILMPQGARRVEFYKKKYLFLSGAPWGVKGRHLGAQGCQNDIRGYPK